MVVLLLLVVVVVVVGSGGGGVVVVAVVVDVVVVVDDDDDDDDVVVVVGVCFCCFLSWLCRRWLERVGNNFEITCVFYFILSALKPSIQDVCSNIPTLWKKAVTSFGVFWIS